MARKPEKLCVVTIGVDSFAVRMSDGLRLVEIMSGAVPVRRLFSSRADTFEPRPMIGDVGLTAIRADQIITLRQPAGHTGPLQLTVTKGA